MRLPAKNNKTPNSRFLDLRSLRYKGYKIKYIENLFRLLKFYKMTFYYLKVVKSKNLDFVVLSWHPH